MGNSSSTLIDTLSSAALSHIPGHFASHQPNGRPRLPLELLEIIVELLDDDKKTLLTLCQVCTYFVVPARRELFRQVTVKAQSKTFEAFLDFLIAKPEIAALVQVLTLLASAVDERGRRVPADHTAVLPSSLLNNLMKTTPNIRSLSLVGIKLKATKLGCPPAFVDLDYLALLNPNAYHDHIQDYASTLVPFVRVGRLRIEQFALPGSHFGGSPPSLSQDIAFDSPILFAAKTIELDVTDSVALARILSVLMSTWSVQNLTPHGPQLRSLALACPNTPAPPQFVRAGCATLEHLTFDLSRWLDVRLWDGYSHWEAPQVAHPSDPWLSYWRHVGQIPGADVGEEFDLREACPALQSVALRVAVDQIKRVTEQTFENVASLLERIPSSVRKLTFEIDLGYRPTSALDYLFGDDMIWRWKALRKQVELARLTNVDLEFRSVAGGEPLDPMAKQAVALKLIDALAPAGVILGFRYDTYDD